MRLLVIAPPLCVYCGKEASGEVIEDGEGDRWHVPCTEDALRRIKSGLAALPSIEETEETALPCGEAGKTKDTEVKKPEESSPTETTLIPCKGDCGQVYPATREFFPPGNYSGGLIPYCRECWREQRRIQREGKKEKAASSVPVKPSKREKPSAASTAKTANSTTVKDASRTHTNAAQNTTVLAQPEDKQPVKPSVVEPLTPQECREWRKRIGVQPRDVVFAASIEETPTHRSWERLQDWEAGGDTLTPEEIRRLRPVLQRMEQREGGEKRGNTGRGKVLLPNLVERLNGRSRLVASGNSR